MVRLALRRHGVSMGLLAATVALGGYLDWGDRDRSTTSETNARQQNLVPAFRRGAFTELTIEQNGQSLRICRAPVDAGEAVYYLGDGELADPPAVDKVLGALEFATVERRLEGKQDKHQLGLDTPRLKVTLVMGGLTFRLAVGSDAPRPRRICLCRERRCGGRRCPRFGDRAIASVRCLSIANPPSVSSVPAGRAFDRRRRGNASILPRCMGGWGSPSMGPSRVDRDAFDRVVSSLANVRAEAFAPAPASEEALGQPSDRLRLTLTPKRPASHAP